MRRQSFSRLGLEKPWKLSMQKDGERFGIHRPSGIWVPSNAKVFKWLGNQDGEGKLYFVAHYSFSNWELNLEVPDAAFSIELPLLSASGR